MPVETLRNQDQDLTTLVVTGAVSEAEMYEALEGFYRQKPTVFLLWDMSQADLAHVTPDMLQRFIRRGAQLGAARRGGRTAVIAPGELQYGLSRMSEMFFELEDTPFSFRVFRSRHEALLWLNAADTSQQSDEGG